MGTILFDFLADSFLLQEKALSSQFSDYSNEEIEKEISKYRSFAEENYQRLFEEVEKNTSKLKVFPGGAFLPIQQITKAALYLDQVLIQDPLYLFSRRTSNVEETMGKFLGFKKHELDRNCLSEICAQITLLRPAIVHEFVKLIPCFLSEVPDSGVPIGFTQNAYFDGLPKPLLDFFRERAKVVSMEKDERGWLVKDTLKLGRAIFITFSGHNRYGQFYHLLEQKLERDLGNGKCEFSMTLPDTPPNQGQFQYWVDQSVNRSAMGVYEELLEEIALSKKLNSTLMTTSSLFFEILGRSTASSIKSHTAEIVLNFDLPSLNDLDLETILSIRRNDGEAFECFRAELDKALRDLRGLEYSDELRVKAENAISEITETQVTRINTTISSIRKKLSIDGALMIGGLTTAIQTNGLTLLPAILAGMNGFKQFQDYFASVKENPSYFFWQVKKGA